METTIPCTHESDFGILNTTIVEIKDTLKDLKDVLTSNAVLAEQVNQIKEASINISTRLHKVEIEMANHSGSDKWIERFIWCFLSAVLGFYIKGVL